MAIYSFCPFGYEGSLCEVEVDLRDGIPALDLVGISDVCVKETRERVRSAISNQGLEMPQKRVLIALSPCDIRKDGAGFDLPIALGILRPETKDNWLVMGELELSGNVRPVRGIFAAITTAKACGITKVICPKDCVAEAMAQGVEVFGVNSLKDAVDVIDGLLELEKMSEIKFREVETDTVNGVEFRKFDKDEVEIENYASALRALQVGIASGCHMLFYGAPGCGKTRIAQYAEWLQPMLSQEESKTVTRIQSIAGLLSANEGYQKVPPFRMPHQTASIEGICGGGPNCRPGEITLAHNGILFLDEAAEFRTSVLQMLRVPLESHQITLARAGRSTCYPAHFQLIMCTNPCPCGNYGSYNKICLCSARSIEQYWKKFSAPLMDRIGIKVKVDESSKNEGSISLEQLRTGIANAVKASRKRGFKWGDATPQYIASLNLCVPQAELGIDDMQPRERMEVIALALTIADMENREVQPIDWVEAKRIHGETPIQF